MRPNSVGARKPIDSLSPARTPGRNAACVHLWFCYVCTLPPDRLVEATSLAPAGNSTQTRDGKLSLDKLGARGDGGKWAGTGERDGMQQMVEPVVEKLCTPAVQATRGHISEIREMVSEQRKANVSVISRLATRKRNGYLNVPICEVRLRYQRFCA